MGRSRLSPLLLACGAIAALAFSACGTSNKADLLPGSTASEIEANLDQVRELAAEGECIGAENAAEAVSSQVRQLGGVDKKLKEALREGATRLSEVVESCEEAEPGESEATEAIEPAEEVEAPEKTTKPEKTKPSKETEAEEPVETTPQTGPSGKGNGSEGEQGEGPVESGGGGAPSGGIGPSTPAGGGG